MLWLAFLLLLVVAWTALVLWSWHATSPRVYRPALGPTRSKTELLDHATELLGQAMNRREAVETRRDGRQAPSRDRESSIRRGASPAP